MRVGVNLCYFRQGGVGGSEVYVRELLGALLETQGIDLVLYGSETNLVSLAGTARCSAKIISRSPYNDASRILDENLRLTRHVRKDRIDLLWSPANFTPLIGLDKPQVATIHDLQHRELWRFFSPARWLARELLFRRTVSCCSRLIAISTYTAEHIKRAFNVPPDRIRVVHEGCGLGERLGRDGQRVRAEKPLVGCRPYCYYPAMLAPHKNHEILLRALAILRKEGTSIDLVLTGKRSDDWNRLSALASRLGVADLVRHKGFVTRAEVLALMSNAECLVFPSQFEGFGLPPLEAMALGVPVIASNRTSLPDIVGDAGILVDPNDAAAWAAAISTVRDPRVRADLIDRGYSNVKRFNWARCAKETADVFTEAAGQRPN